MPQTRKGGRRRNHFGYVVLRVPSEDSWRLELGCEPTTRIG